MLRKYILMVETFSFLIREICITNLFAITLQMLALARTFMFTPLVLVSVALQAIPFLINVFPLLFFCFKVPFSDFPHSQNIFFCCIYQMLILHTALICHVTLKLYILLFTPLYSSVTVF